MNRIKYLFGMFYLLLAISCTKKFLDVENTQQLFRESYVKDLTSMQEYVRGVYYTLAIEVESSNTVAPYVDLVADNLKPATTSANPYYNWAQTQLVSLNSMWTNSYMAIRMCSFVIDNVDKYRDENPQQADYIKGQAYGIRAYVYFRLVNIFAQHYTFTADASHPGVPYITTSDITKPYTRQTVQEVYAGMINDLKSANQHLPAVITDTRYMNRNAAKALLARVYLFKEDFNNAKTTAEELAAEVPLMTIGAGYPDDVFKFKPAASTETLFQLTPFNLINFLGKLVRRGPINYVATNDVANILRENLHDVRSNWIKDSTLAGKPVRLVKKFPVGLAPEVSPAITNLDVSYYVPVLRSSEMFLTVAEAAARTNDETKANSFLNRVRKRANPSLPDLNLSGPPLLDSIYKERRKELAFEALRMFDLQRWKMGVNRQDVVPGSPAQLPYPSNKAIGSIPNNEVIYGHISQNPGY
jgi:hypothetical protein